MIFKNVRPRKNTFFLTVTNALNDLTTRKVKILIERFNICLDVSILIVIHFKLIIAIEKNVHQEFFLSSNDDTLENWTTINNQHQYEVYIEGTM